MKKRAIQQFWTEHAPWIEVLKEHSSDELRQQYIRLDERRCSLEPYCLMLIKSVAQAGRSVLEVGCGLGTDLRLFAKHGMDVVGIDLSHQNAYLTKQGIKALRLQGEVLVADAEHLPFRGLSFDLVYSFGVLHHTPDTRGAIHSLFEVLREGGRAMVVLYHKGLAWYWIIFRYGLLRLELFRLGVEKLISKRYDHTELSKMYSKRETKELFTDFASISFECINYGGIQEHPIYKFLWLIFKKFPPLERILGSFLVIRAKKSISASG